MRKKPRSSSQGRAVPPSQIRNWLPSSCSTHSPPGMPQVSNMMPHSIPVRPPGAPTWSVTQGWIKPHQMLVELTAPVAQAVVADLHVLVGSVPWRRASLNRLIRNIAVQTSLPAVVHLVLDGPDVPNAVLDVLPLTSRGVKVDIREQPVCQGAGSRWAVLDSLADTDIVCNLDDDVGLASNYYLAEHYAALRGCDAVCVGGYTPTGQFFMCTHAGVSYNGPINCLQAGAFSLRVRCLRGLRAMPMADEMLGVLGDDEGLIAAHLWKTGVVVRRVNTPVGFDSSAGDPRSQFLTRPERITMFRRRLRHLTGWPWGLM